MIFSAVNEPGPLVSLLNTHHYYVVCILGNTPLVVRLADIDIVYVRSNVASNTSEAQLFAYLIRTKRQNTSGQSMIQVIRNQGGRLLSFSVGGLLLMETTECLWIERAERGHV